MIEITVLETVCECDIWIDVKTVTDEDVEAWTDQALIEDRPQVSQIATKMKKVKTGLQIESPSLRVTDLYVKFNKTVKDNGWKQFFEDEYLKEDEDQVP